jgi:hypothetical protein
MYFCLFLPRLALACSEAEKRSVSQAEFEKVPHEAGFTVMLF